MTTRSNGPLAGFDWLKRGINVGYANPRAVLGGAAFLLLLAVVSALITLPIQFGSTRGGAQPDPSTFGLVMAIAALSGLLLIPLYAGYLQVIDAAERGLPTRARDVFRPYRQGDVMRFIGYGLAMLALYVVSAAVIIVATGSGIARWYMQLVTAQLHQQPPPVALPDGFGIAIALFFVLMLFLLGVYSISLGQIALRRRSVLGAIGDGIVGALKNLLPLLVFIVSSMVAWIVLTIVVVLLVFLVSFLGKLAGTWLVVALAIPLYIAMLLMIFAVMFGVMYYLWRDVCGDDDSMPAVAQSITV